MKKIYEYSGRDDPRFFSTKKKAYDHAAQFDDFISYQTTCKYLRECGVCPANEAEDVFIIERIVE